MPEVKHCIWLIKEPGWGILITLPFKKMPQVMLIELICHMGLWLNAFPTKKGVGKVIPPCKIMICQKLDFAKHCQAVFGLYYKVHNKLMFLAYLGQTHEVLRTDHRAKHQSQFSIRTLII